jgi:hypothetical protein
VMIAPCLLTRALFHEKLNKELALLSRVIVRMTARASYRYQ